MTCHYYSSCTFFRTHTVRLFFSQSMMPFCCLMRPHIFVATFILAGTTPSLSFGVVVALIVSTAFPLCSLVCSLIVVHRTTLPIDSDRDTQPFAFECCIYTDTCTCDYTDKHTHGFSAETSSAAEDLRRRVPSSEGNSNAVFDGWRIPCLVDRVVVEGRRDRFCSCPCVFVVGRFVFFVPHRFVDWSDVSHFF